MFSFDMKGDQFTILNLTDMQLNECHYDPNDPGYDDSFAVMDYTIRTLIDRVKPELITITGDISMADQPKAYPAFADYMDRFDIPWCLVWGNHDQQEADGIAFVNSVLPYYRTKKNFFHEDGDPSLGNGNYLIAINRDGRPVHVLFMIDSHNCVWLPDDKGEKHFFYDKLTDRQLVWYREQAALVRARGCRHSSILMHIPMHAYLDAWRAAFRAGLDPRAITVEQSYGPSCWNEGYEDAFGVGYEEPACYPFDDGVFTAIKEMDITDNVLVGHCHVINTVIPYQGVRLAFATKTGKVHPWTKALNGGTVITIHPDGRSALRHEYVNVDHLLWHKND